MSIERVNVHWSAAGDPAPPHVPMPVPEPLPSPYPAPSPEPYPEPYPTARSRESWFERGLVCHTFP